jgi:hypothetical protein
MRVLKRGLAAGTGARSVKASGGQRSRGVRWGGGPVRGHRRVGRPRKEKGKWARLSKTVQTAI